MDPTEFEAHLKLTMEIVRKDREEKKKKQEQKDLKEYKETQEKRLEKYKKQNQQGKQWMSQFKIFPKNFQPDSTTMELFYSEFN